jgi:predicted O-methyltransferase YrrM
MIERYMLGCLNNTKSAVECGTSFGVSTAYIALAIARNTSNRRNEADGVITKEKDSAKIEYAKRIWAEAGLEIEEWITPLEGDLLQLLEMESILPATIDLLFLDGNSIPLLHVFILSLIGRSMDFIGTSGASVSLAEVPTWLPGLCG